jgi:catalase
MGFNNTTKRPLKNPSFCTGNIVDHLGSALKRIQLRQAAIFFKTDPEYGRRVAEGLGLDVPQVERLSEMSQKPQVKG